MKKLHRSLAWGVMLAAIASVSVAGAHEDPNPDGNNNSATRCDTWYRETHESGSGSNKHSEDHTNEFDNGEVAPGVYVHNHTGHYVVRGDGFYIEVVGGGGYSRDGNQGGYVQGEVDPVEGAPDADFHFDSFAGARSPTTDDAHVCLSVADTKVGDEGEQP